MTLNTKTLATRPRVYLLLCVVTFANKGLRFGHVQRISTLTVVTMKIIYVMRCDSVWSARLLLCIWRPKLTDISLKNQVLTSQRTLPVCIRGFSL